MSQLLRAGLLISAGLLLGRAAGFIREAILAARFGVSADADVAVLLITLPELLVNLLAAGGLSAALIPALQALPQQRRPALFVQASLAFTAAFAVVAAAAMWVAPALLHLLAPGLGPSLVAEATPLVRLSLWAIPLTALSGVAVAYLHTHQRFGVAALGTLIFNVVLIVGLLIGDGSGALLVLAWAVLAAGIVRWASQLIVIPRPFLLGAAFSSRHLHSSLLVQYFHASSAATVLLLMPVVARAFASVEGEGKLAAFNYSIKLIELPLSAGVYAFVGAAFPRLAEYAARDNGAGEFHVLFEQTLKMVVLLSFTAMWPMLFYCNDIVELIFGWGKMNASDLEGIAFTTRLILISLPLQGLYWLLTIALNARRDMSKPLLANCVGIALFCVLAWVSGNILNAGVAGVAAGLGFAYSAMLVVSALFAAKSHGIHLLRLLISRDLIVGVLVILVAVMLSSMVTWDMELPAFVAVAIAGASGLVGLGAAFLVRPNLRQILRWSRAPSLPSVNLDSGIG